jgi:AraC-like DNA-binding protein
MKDAIHIKYLVANEQDALWGLTVNSVGFQNIEANTSYPPDNHPTRYLFSPQEGRILDEFQLIYISKGKGCFSSKSCEQTEIKGGDFFLLFPGEWHNYRPSQGTGWNEYWIGFSGVNMDSRVQNNFFSKLKPIFNVGLNEEIVQLYQLAIQVAKAQETGFQQMLAGIVNYLLGLIYAKDKLNTFEDLRVVNQINEAKIIMLDLYAKEIKLENIAQQVNMSYSWFRRVFRQYTGFSPSQYLQELRLQKGKDLLTNTLKPIKEIAYEVGFENADYFCTVFRNKTGSTPMKYRDFTRGRIATK